MAGLGLMTSQGARRGPGVRGVPAHLRRSWGLWRSRLFTVVPGCRGGPGGSRWFRGLWRLWDFRMVPVRGVPTARDIPRACGSPGGVG